MRGRPPLDGQRAPAAFIVGGGRVSLASIDRQTDRLSLSCCLSHLSHRDSETSKTVYSMVSYTRGSFLET